MKRFLTLSITAFAIQLAAVASTACSGLTTFQDYITAGSCTVAGPGTQSFTLNSFTYLGVSLLTTGTTAADINVATSAGVNGPTVTFSPDAKFSVLPSLAGTDTVLFGFDILSNTPNIEFTGVALGETSLLTGLSTGLVAEENCYGGALPTPTNLLSLGNGGLACLTGGISVGASVGNNLLLSAGHDANATVNLLSNQGPVSSVDVLKEISLTGLLGGAAVTGVTQSFNTTTVTPEPASYFLGGCGLIVLAMLRHRRMPPNSEK